MTPYIVIFVTAKDQEEGGRIARALLEEKLAACVNISAGIKSLFWWEGQIDTGEEVLLLIKSKKKLLPKILKTVKKHHSYTVPEIIALPIVAGSKDYLQWVENETKS